MNQTPVLLEERADHGLAQFALLSSVPRDSKVLERRKRDTTALCAHEIE